MIQKRVQILQNWIEDNAQKIVVVIAINVGIYYVSTLPYINVIMASASFIPYVLMAVSILFILRPKRVVILLIALGLLCLAIPVSLLSQKKILENIGNLSYILLGTYILMYLSDKSD